MEYTLNDINLFIKHYLSEDLVDYLDGDGYELIINIRRTDFYSDALKYFYGFNQIKYVKKAIRKFDKFSKIAVISDDIDWCKEHLAFLNKKYKQVDFLNLPPFESFIELIKAKNLIIANSTFSFWAAYINHYFNPSSRIVAPNYYTSLINNGELITSPSNWETINVTIYKDKSKIIKTYLSKIKHKVIALAKKIRKVLIGR